ncbi:MAG: OmpA family protein [Nitrospira sp.]|nr:OmpA family protein [Nitrospira sp.]
MLPWYRAIVFFALLPLFTIGCAEDDPYRKTKMGAAIGGAIGAGAGAAIDKNNRARGAAIGGAVGVLAGGAVGFYMDRQKKAIEEKLAKELANHDVEIKKLPDNTIEVDLKGEATFASNSSDVKPSFADALAKLGGVIAEYDSTAVHVIGHTDNQGSTAYNQQLSQARATAVAARLMSAGVHQRRVLTEGRGETQPKASNASSEGRSQNRRVEIYLKPVVEGQEQTAFAPPQ